MNFCNFIGVWQCALGVVVVVVVTGAVADGGVSPTSVEKGWVGKGNVVAFVSQAWED